MTKPRERRMHNRASVAGRATLMVGGRLVNCELVDISQSGIALLTPGAIDRGRSVTVAFVLESNRATVELEGFIVRSRKQATGLCLAGVEFAAVDAWTSAQLRSYVQRRLFDERVLAKRGRPSAPPAAAVPTVGPIVTAAPGPTGNLSTRPLPGRGNPVAPSGRRRPPTDNLPVSQRVRTTETLAAVSDDDEIVSDSDDGFVMQRARTRETPALLTDDAEGHRQPKPSQVTGPSPVTPADIRRRRAAAAERGPQPKSMASTPPNTRRVVLRRNRSQGGDSRSAAMPEAPRASEVAPQGPRPAAVATAPAAQTRPAQSTTSTSTAALRVVKGGSGSGEYRRQTETVPKTTLVITPEIVGAKRRMPSSANSQTPDSARSRQPPSRPEASSRGPTPAERQHLMSLYRDALQDVRGPAKATEKSKRRKSG